LCRQSFFTPASNTIEVVDQLQEARLAAELNQRPVQRVFDGTRFLPGEVVLLRRLDCAIAQAFRVVAGHQQLHGGEEGLNEVLLLVFQILPDTPRHRDRRALELQQPERDAVDVEDDVRALGERLGTGARHRHFLGDGEVVPLRLLPVDEPDGLRVLADLGLHLHAVAQQLVHVAVAVVEALAGVPRGLIEKIKSPRYQGFVIALRILQERP
jgi:hypothetical protein